MLVGSVRDGAELTADPDTLLVQLVHLSADRRNAAVVHFPRELKLKVPGQRRLTVDQTYATGGSALVADTLQHRLGLHIDHVAQLDFEAYVGATDRVGKVDLTDDSAGALTGDQSLAWSTDSDKPDIELGRRHQDWERALLHESLRPGVVFNPLTLLGLTRSFTSNTVLDETFTTGEVRSLLWGSRKLTPKSIIFFTAPVKDPAAALVAPAGKPITPDLSDFTALGQALAADNTSALASFDN